MQEEAEQPNHLAPIPSPHDLMDYGIELAPSLIDQFEAETGEQVETILPSFFKNTRTLIEAANATRTERGAWGGLSLGDTRFKQLNQHWGGIDHGIHLIGGDTNLGKSSVLRMIAWDIVKNEVHNPNIHLRFYTLDDSEPYFLDCMVAQAAGVPINSVHKPDAWINREETAFYKKEDYERHVQRGHEMYQEFLDGKYLHRFSFVGTDTLQSPNFENIKRDMLRVKNELPPGTQLVVCFDNFHDIELEGYSENDSRTERVAVEADLLRKQVNGIFLGTVELKKNQQRRPILDDIYGSRKWKYKARSVFLIYSEVGTGKPNPRIYFERSDRPQGELCSVLEMHLAKAKGNDFKGRLFYEQLTEKGLMLEVPKSKAAEYAAMIS